MFNKVTKLQCYIFIIRISIICSNSSLEDWFFSFTQKSIFSLLLISDSAEPAHFEVGGFMYKNKGCVSLRPLHPKSGRTNGLEIPGTQRSFHSTAHLGHLACLKNLAQRHGQCAGEGTRYGWSALCPGKPLTFHLSAEAGPTASYGDILGISVKFPDMYLLCDQ